MKADDIKIITIASSNNRKVDEKFEEMQNKKLIELYKQFQEKPFEYAKIDYFEHREPKVTTYPKESGLTKIINKIKKIFKK